MNAVLGGGSIAAPVALCRRPIRNRRCRCTFTLTPFYVMNAASYFSHIFSSLLIMLLCLCLPPDGEIVRGHKLVAAGAIVGLLAMTRYFDVLSQLLSGFLFWPWSTAWPRLLQLIAFKFIPFLVLLMIYQYLAHSVAHILSSPQRKYRNIP